MGGFVLFLESFSIWAIAMAGILIPLKWEKTETDFCIVNSFVAGLMLSAGFVHMLSDAANTLHEIYPKFAVAEVFNIYLKMSLFTVHRHRHTHT